MYNVHLRLGLIAIVIHHVWLLQRHITLVQWHRSLIIRMHVHWRASGLRSLSSPIRISWNVRILRCNHVRRNILVLVLRNKRCILIIIGKWIIIGNGHVHLDVPKSRMRVGIWWNWWGHVVHIVIGIFGIVVVASIHVD